MPEGWRLVFLPSLTGHLLSSAAAGMVIPLVVTLPATLFCVLPVAGVVGGGAGALRTGLVLFGLLLLAGVAVAVALVRAAGTDVRWVELRPGAAPTVLVVRRVWGRSTVRVADLRRVVVVERRKLDRRIGVQVVVHTGGETVTCTAGQGSPTERVGVAQLAGWVSERLASAGVLVEWETVTEPALLTVENWWTAEKVAQAWRVPVARVPEIAQQQGVRSHTGLSRIGATHQPGRSTGPRYDPDDVCRVAARRSVEERAPGG